MMNVKIEATDENVNVTVTDDNDAAGSAEFTYEIPPMLTGADLAEILTACGVRVKYTWNGEGEDEICECGRPPEDCIAFDGDDTTHGDRA